MNDQEKQLREWQNWLCAVLMTTDATHVSIFNSMREYGEGVLERRLERDRAAILDQPESPTCLGYPTCDGDLPGEWHERECPKWTEADGKLAEEWKHRQHGKRAQPEPQPTELRERVASFVFNNLGYGPSESIKRLMAFVQQEIARAQPTERRPGESWSCFVCHEPTDALFALCESHKHLLRAQAPKCICDADSKWLCPVHKEAQPPSVTDALGTRPTEAQDTELRERWARMYLHAIFTSDPDGCPYKKYVTLPTEEFDAFNYAMGNIDVRAELKEFKERLGVQRELAQAQQPPAELRESGWLIENAESMWASLIYVPYKHFKWTRDSWKALRFSRKVDAEAVIQFMQSSEALKATEHVWIGTESAPAQRTEPDTWMLGTASLLESMSLVTLGDDVPIKKRVILDIVMELRARAQGGELQGCTCESGAESVREVIQ